MSQTIKFYKLKTNEDIVAYEVNTSDSFYEIRRPLVISVENEIQSGRQMLDAREWIPPIVCRTDTIFLPKDFVIFSTDIRDSFREEFEEVVEFLYNVEPRPKKGRSRGKDIPLMLKDPSTKPN